MRIGEDVVIQECRDQGYIVMDYPVRKFKRNPTTTDCRFTVSFPDYMQDGFVGEKILYIDELLNWEDLWVMYLENKEGIDSMIYQPYKKADKPNPYILLSLASDIHGYCGLA